MSKCNFNVPLPSLATATVLRIYWSRVTYLFRFSFQDSLLFHVYGLKLLVLKLPFTALWIEKQRGRDNVVTTLLLEVKRIQQVFGGSYKLSVSSFAII